MRAPVVLADAVSAVSAELVDHPHVAAPVLGGARRFAERDEEW